jgi:hypothetical protein
MKKSSPINLRFTSKPNQTGTSNPKHLGKVKILTDWERLFQDINLKNNGAIVIPRFSTIPG